MWIRWSLLILVLGSVVAWAELAPPSPAAEKAWSELQVLMRGPREASESVEDARAKAKRFFLDYDTKAAAFRKAFPEDPRRWRLTLHEVQLNEMRAMMGVPSKKPAELLEACAAIVAAENADPITKATASFTRVGLVQNEAVAFVRLAEEHLAAFPNYPRNPQLDNMVRSKKTEQDLKSKPLELKVTSTDGQSIDLANLRGKVVLLYFWASTCAPCATEAPNLVAAYAKYKAQGFEIIGLSFDEEREAMDKFVKEKQFTWPQAFDGRVWQSDYAQRFGIISIPRMWLVNKKGLLADANARQDLTTKIEKLLSE